MTGLYNSIANAYLNLGENDSAIYYFQKALEANTKFNGLRKNNDYGTTNKLTGDLLVSEEKYT
ncbi:MAG: tetratricopeptide repeat protein, partial [Bacteroidota bacterium]